MGITMKTLWKMLLAAALIVPLLPVKPVGASGVTESRLAADNNVSYLVRDGVVWAWGRNHAAQLGNGTTNDSSMPVRVGTDHDGLPFHNVVAIAASGTHTVAVKRDGTVWAWGDNKYGQLGDGTNQGKSRPVQITEDADGQPFGNVVAVAAALGTESHTLALKSDGTVWAWGGNTSGQLGLGIKGNRNRPVQITADKNGQTFDNVIAINASTHTSVALKGDGTVWTWGGNSSGELGDGTTQSAGIPQMVETDIDGNDFNNVVAISFKGHTLALKRDGTVWAWGNNSFGQVGDGTAWLPNFDDENRAKVKPVHVSIDNEGHPFNDIVSVAAGSVFSFAIKKDGSVWAWGQNSGGALGDGTDKDKNRPIQVNQDANHPLQNVLTIAGGGSHGLALGSDGAVRSWGLNLYGQLGNGESGSGSTKRIPVQALFSSSAELTDLSISSVSLIPSFRKDITIYEVETAFDVRTITVTPTAEAADAIITMQLNGEAPTLVLNGRAAPPLVLRTGINRLAIRVTAPDQSRSLTYRVNLTRSEAPADSADLDGIHLSGGAKLNESFDKDRLDYSANVPYIIDNVGIKPIFANPKASVTIDGTAVQTGKTFYKTLTMDMNQVSIQVISEDASASKTYTLQITRTKADAAPIHSLPVVSVNPGVPFATLIYDPVHAYAGEFMEINSSGVTGQIKGETVDDTGNKSENGDYTLLSGILYKSGDITDGVAVKVELPNGHEVHVRFRTAPTPDGDFHVGSTDGAKQGDSDESP